MAKIKALKKDVFDIDKITVIGSPTITSDGIASGFSTNAYLNTNIIIGQKPFKITIPFNAPSGTMGFVDVSSGNGWYPLIRIDNDYLLSQVKTTSGTSLSNMAIRCPRNIDCICTFEFTGTKYIMGLFNGTDWAYVENSKSEYLANMDKPIILGNYGTFKDQYFKGSIDLTQFKIYVDGELVYSPTKPVYSLERRKEGFDLSKFTVIGTPNITDDGIATNFSGSNYVSTQNKFSIDISKNFEVYLKLKNIKYQSGLGDTGVIRFNTNSNIRFDLRYNGKFFYLVSNGTGNASDSTGIKYFSYDRDMDVEIIFGIKGTTFYGKIKRSYDTVWRNLSTTTINIDDTFTNAFIQFGLGWGNYMTSETGSIDLTQFSITVDGKEVFTGAKQEYYGMRGGK